ncbi:MAG: glycoside hydrolase [Clostridia bacterium]|nr:glycoside hydrolase [Clostridia bacterium]MDE7328177.1 glycoside hydrolase [Clostridia bacterium]
MNIPTVTKVFSKESGRAEHYRIPSIIKTKRGTLVACADERFFTARDNPNRIDKVVRRSVDDGATWQEQIVAVEEIGESQTDASAAIDPALLYDEDTDTIFMLYSHTPAGVGILNCRNGIGQDKDGNLYLYEGKKRYILKGDSVYFENGEKNPDWQARENGDLFFKGEPAGNYKLKSGKLKELLTSHVYILTSEDDGLTWSKPRNITYQVKEKYMSFIGAGPGVGICVKEGKYKGRLIFPIYYNTSPIPTTGILMLSACVMYSDDKGKTWRRGKSPNQTRKRLGVKIGHRIVADWDCITESQLIELPNGQLKLFMRNHSRKKLVATALSDDGGATWHSYKHNLELPQCICQCSVTKGEDDGKEVTVFLNAADKKARRNGVIRLSYDYGETFPYCKLIKEGEFVYSSIVWLGGGKVGVLYEEDTKHEEINYTVVSLDFIKEK